LLAEERFYQRLLSGDATDAADNAEDQLKTQSLSAYYDAVAVKALVLAHTDAAEGKLSDERQQKLQATMDEIIDDLSDYSDETPSEVPAGNDAEDVKGTLEAQPTSSGKFLCIASRSALDGAAAAMLAQILGKRRLAAVLQPVAPSASGPEVPVEARDATFVCLSYFGAASRPAHVRYLIRRLRRLMPQARFIACFWMLGDEPKKLEDWKHSVGADFVATSLDQAAMICCREAESPRLEIAA